MFGLIAGVAMMLLFAHSLSWVFALVGSEGGERGSRPGRVVPDPRAAGLRVDRVRVGRVDARRRSKWFANHQPVSIVIDAVRALTYGGPFASTGKVLGGDRVERRDHRGRGAAGRAHVPPQGLIVRPRSRRIPVVAVPFAGSVRLNRPPLCVDA